jgi:hypothetical protein
MNHLRDTRIGFGSGLRAEIERRANEEETPAISPVDDDQPVSPELVLICPELRAVELARL